MLFTIVRRHDLQDVIEAIRTCNPGAFYSAEDVSAARVGIFPARSADGCGSLWRRLHTLRKGK